MEVIKLKAWIIYGEQDAAYNKNYIDFYFDEGKKLDLEFQLIIVEKLQIGLKENVLFLEYENTPITLPDFVICRTIYPLLSHHLENMGVLVFNNAFIADMCNDKARTYQYVAKTGIKIVDTVFGKGKNLEEKMDQIEEGTVIKSVNGHGGQEVFLLEEDNKSLIIQSLKNKDVVMQPLTGHSHEDLRVYVVGKKIIAGVLRKAKGGFKSNYSLGGQVSCYTLSSKEIEEVNKIIQLFDFGLVGIDFLIGDHGELIFNEIEDVVGARMLYQCSDVNIVREYLVYILDRISGIKTENKGMYEQSGFSTLNSPALHS